MFKNNLTIYLLAIAISFSFLYCNTQEEEKDLQTQSQTTLKEAPATESDSLDFITDAWIRPASDGMSTALYLKIENNTDIPDTLYKASADFAELTQIHETIKENDTMKMQEVEHVVIAPASYFQLKPGGHHIMLINTTEEVTKGTERTVTLYFTNKGEVVVNAPVIDKTPMKMEH